MNICTREVIRNEIKVLAFRRKTSKKQARKLQQSAQEAFTEFENSESELKYWENPLWLTARQRTDAASKLQMSGASDARHYNIAYALMRGMSYQQVERSCKEAPSAEKILEIIVKHEHFSEKAKWTLKIIKDLLK